jgi:hypothetical protein
MISAARLRMHEERLVICDSKHIVLALWSSVDGDVICVLL